MERSEVLSPFRSLTKIWRVSSESEVEEVEEVMEEDRKERMVASFMCWVVGVVRSWKGAGFGLG